MSTDGQREPLRPADQAVASAYTKRVNQLLDRCFSRHEPKTYQLMCQHLREGLTRRLINFRSNFG